MSAVLYATNRSLSKGLRLRTIRTGSRSPGDHPWLGAFRRALTREDLATLTVSGYARDVGDFLRWYGAAALERLSVVDLVHYRDHLIRERDAKPATVNRKLEALRRFTRWAHAGGKLAAPLGAELKLARAVRGRCPKGLTAAEVQTLLRAAGQSGRGLARRNYALIQVMLQAGLRVGEVATLTCADLELHDRSGQVRVHGKGAKERVVPLNTTARRALHAYFKDRAPLSGKTPVFLSESGAGLSLRSMQALIANLARRAKIAHAVSAHACRHTFALNFLKQHPGKLVELAVLLGHDSVETTAVYTQPSAEEMAEDLERSPLNVER
jgi:site-specific recombinase XerD